MNFNLCDSETALAAANYLSKSRDVFVDVQGQNLGYEHGELQILIIATVMRGHHAFLFDVRRLPLNVMMPVLDILKNGETRKIVWNGRRANLALHSEYGIQLGCVLDLQLADTVSRGNSPWRFEAINRPSHPLHDVRGLDLKGIYPLASFKCALRSYSASDSDSNDKALEDVALGLGKAARHLMWKDPQVVPRAVTTIAVLRRIYAVFLRRGIVKTERGANLELEAASMRYAAMDSAPLKPGNQYQMPDILPMEILSAPAADGPKSECNKCRRMLSEESFAYKADLLGRASCRVCFVIDARSAARARAFTKVTRDLSSTVSSSVVKGPAPPPDLASLTGKDAVMQNADATSDMPDAARGLKLIESAILREGLVESQRV